MLYIGEEFHDVRLLMGVQVFPTVLGLLNGWVVIKAAMKKPHKFSCLSLPLPATIRVKICYHWFYIHH